MSEGRLGKPPEDQGRGGGGGEDRRRGGEGERKKRLLPFSVRRDLNRRKKVPFTVSLGFEDFQEQPSSMEIGRWLVKQELDPTKGFAIKRISRSEQDHRFYLQLEGEAMVDKFVEEFGQDGKEWKDKNGLVSWIKAKKEGEDWIEVKITNIDPDTPRDQVETYFSHVGEVKDLKQDEVNGMVLDSATIKVKLKDDVEMPTYLVVKGVPGNSEGVVVWQLDYPDKPMVCYRCYQQGHRRRDCRSPPVPITALLARPNLADGGVKGSYAQVVKSKEAERAEQQKAEEKQRQKKVEEDKKKKKEEEEEVERERRRSEIADVEKQREKDKADLEKLKNLKDEMLKQKKVYDEEENRLKKTQGDLMRRRERLQKWKEEVDDEDKFVDEEERKSRKRRSLGSGVDSRERSRSGEFRGDRHQTPYRH